MKDWAYKLVAVFAVVAMTASAMAQAHRATMVTLALGNDAPWWANLLEKGGPFVITAVLIFGAGAYCLDWLWRRVGSPATVAWTEIVEGMAEISTEFSNYAEQMEGASRRSEQAAGRAEAAATRSEHAATKLERVIERYETLMLTRRQPAGEPGKVGD